MTRPDVPSVLFLVSDLSLAGEPHGVMQLAAYAHQRGWNPLLSTLRDDYLTIVKVKRPQLIAASVMSSDIKPFSLAFKSIKAGFPRIPLVMGGPHSTFVPDSANTMEVDAVVVGEGDSAFREILARIEGGKGLEAIENVAIRGRGYRLGDLIPDLDSLPDIRRDFVYHHRDRMLGQFKLKSFFTSRGCPYRCTYCFNHAYNKLYRGKGRIVRKRSVDAVIEEVLKVKREYPLEYIRFSDDVFVLKVDDWLDEFRRKFWRRVGVPFYCLVRASNVNEDMVKSLKEAGCKSACMSIESGNGSIRANILGRSMSNKEIIDAFDLFNGHGINMYTNSMIAVPGATIEDELRSLDLAIRCRAKYSGFTIITPYPGTDFYDYCEGEGVLPQGLSMEELMAPSTGCRSVLTCFSEEEKKCQVKFLKLAPLTASFPLLKGMVAFLVKHIPDNPLFDLVYWFTKYYRFGRYIAPIKFSAADVARLLRRSYQEEMHQINKG